MIERPRTAFVPRWAPIVVLIACGFSAGIHFALTPEHVEESTRLGVGFALSGVLLLVLAVQIYVRPRSSSAPVLAALLLVALIAAYLLSRTVGLPGSGHETESFDAVGLATKSVELVGLMAAIGLHLENRSWLEPLLTTRSTT